jgi:predicted DCC family thiol-disulfide oxidoreductase YuxK
VETKRHTGRARPTWDIKVLYDGECPLCMREVAMLRRRNREGRAAFEDIAAPGFDPARYGLDHEAVMGRIHGVLPDGRVVEGVEVFRRVYEAVGLGWLMAPSRWPGVRRLYDWGYRVFARNRLRITGRRDACAEGSCRTPAGEPSAKPLAEG